MVWPWPDTRQPPRCSLSPHAKQENIRWKFSWANCEIVYQLLSQGKQIQFGENNFHLLPTKIELDCEKQKKTWNHLTPITPLFLPDSTSLLPSWLLYLPFPSQCWRDGEGGCGQFITILLCHSFLLICGSPRPWVLLTGSKKYLPAWALHRPQILQGIFICSKAVSSRGFST